MTSSAGFPAERHLDVREDIERGNEPFRKIVTAVDTLRPGEALVLHVPFEPVPLYKVLGARGFAHRAEHRAPGEWWVWLYRDTVPSTSLSTATPGTGLEPDAARKAEARRLDVRGTEPPWPMVRVLEALEHFAPGDRLEVLHDRRPLFLYPQLDARGFHHATDESEAGVVRITIWREEDPA